MAGRGLTAEGLHFQTCLPRVDGRASADDAQAGLTSLVARARAAWPGPGAPPVRLLPALVPFTDLPPSGGGRGVVLGLEEPDLGPACVDLGGTDPHFLVFGDSESGKTACLRALVTTLTASFGPEEVTVLVVDYRRGLLDAVHPGHLFGYAGAVPAVNAHVARLRELLGVRLPGADVPRQQLRDRSWWSGPDVYVVVDDYDLVVTPGGNPLAPLLEYVAQGRDLGLHLVLARRVSGASRAMFEPGFQRVKELGSPGLVLSGDAQEGALIGACRAAEQPPGRGLLVRRGQPPRLVQVAWVPP
jgi:S-DNA-T family DNA segregation ATPase FtsK/SpoIIIE